jgi:tol-pal system protein YbgF
MMMVTTVMTKKSKFFRAALVAALLFLGSTPLSIPTPSLAQSNADLQSLTERLNRLDRDMVTMRRQVFRGESGAAPSSGVDTSGQINENLSERINDLEASLRNLTGQVEQQSFTIRQENTQLKERVSEMDLRLRKMESSLSLLSAAAQASQQNAAAQNTGAAPSPAPAAAPAGIANNAITVPPEPNGKAPAANTPAPTPTTTSGQLGVLKTDPQGKTKAIADPKVITSATPAAPAPAAKPAEEKPAAAATPTSGRDQYNRAFSYLQQMNYAEAEKSFKGYIAANPSESLTGNALFWLGETYTAQKNYAEAASQYLESYRKFPKGSKSVESLLKLGSSLGAMGEKAQACQSFDRLLKEHPDAPSSLKQRADTEKKQLSCP